MRDIDGALAPQIDRGAGQKGVDLEARGEAAIGDRNADR